MERRKRAKSMIHRDGIVASLGLALAFAAAAQSMEDPDAGALRIDSIRKASGRIELSFPFQERRDYLLERSEDLEHWVLTSNFVAESMDGRATILLPLNDAQTAYFRVHLPAINPPEFVSQRYPNYAEWRAACQRLPFNRETAEPELPHDLLPIQTYAEFEELLDAALQLFVSGPLARPDAWVGGMPEQDTFFNTDAAYFSETAIPFQPFAAKLRVPPGSRALFHGDFHGDVHSLLGMLDWLNAQGWLDGFHITDPDLYLIFLGDYTDRGFYGLEVIYTLLRLKLANPDRTLLVRGNHEDYRLNLGYGFTAEIAAKYGSTFNLERYWRFYDFLPVVLYFGVGRDFLQCCHGGMEPGFHPADLLASPCRQNFQLLGTLRRGAFRDSHPELTENLDPNSGAVAADALVDFIPTSPARPSPIGFLWNDFYLLTEHPGLGYLQGRGFLYGQSASRLVLQAAGDPSAQVRAVFRAHQHRTWLDPVMRRLLASDGVYQHWQPQDHPEILHAGIDHLRSILQTSEIRNIPEHSVWTFNVAPDSVYGANLNYSFDSFAILTTAPVFAHWKLQVIRQSILP